MSFSKGGINMSYKLTIISLISMLLMLILSITLNNSITIKYLGWLSVIVFAITIFIVVPIFEYVKSEEKKISLLISPILHIILIIIFLLYRHNKNIMISTMYMSIIIIIITEIFKNKKVTLKNIIYIIVVIVCIFINIKLQIGIL